MSMKSKTAFTASLVLIAVVGLGVGQILRRTPTRGPAAAEGSGKSAHFRPGALHVSKPNQLLDVTVEPVGGFPSSNDQETVLRATITVRQPLDGNVSLQWRLPEGVELVSGELEGALSDVEPGQSVSREISVRGFSSEGLPRNIALEAGGTVAGVAVGTTGVVSSHPTQRDLSIGFRSPKTGAAGSASKIEAQDLDEGPRKPAIPRGIKL